MLSGYANLMGRVERKLFAAMHRDDFNRNATKTTFISQYGITGRQFNSLRMFLDGKIRSRKEVLKRQVKELGQRQEAVKKTVTAMQDKLTALKQSGAVDTAIQKQAFLLHNKKRYLKSLSHRITAAQNQLSKKVPSLCFGGRTRQNAQHHLEKNHFENHEAWVEQWQASREGAIILVGSKDEAWGNQSARLIPQEDGRYSLHLRFPDALGGGYHTLSNVSFSYGSDVIAQATESNRLRQFHSKKPQLDKLKALRTEATKNALLENYGQALTVKLTRHKHGWQLAVTAEEHSPHQTFVGFDSGALGVDVNADHLALSVVDVKGNLVHVESYPIDLSTHAATSHQRAAAIGDAGKHVVALAERYGVGIAHEKLDFDVKKSALKEGKHHKKYRVMLSTLSYRQVLNAILRRAYRRGLKTESVDPKLTSVIGGLKYKNSKITSHEAAAIVIARRGLGLIKEKIRFVFTTKDQAIVNALLATASMPADPFRRWLKVKRLLSVKPARQAKLYDTNVSVKVTVSPVLLTA